MFNRGLKERIATLEDKLQRISDLAHDAVAQGYSPKGSPSEHRFECIAAIATWRMTVSEFAEARQKMADELMADEGLYIGYQANVAMLLHDRYGITDHSVRNQAADEILSLIFSIPPKAPDRAE